MKRYNKQEFKKYIKEESNLSKNYKRIQPAYERRRFIGYINFIKIRKNILAYFLKYWISV